MAEEMTETIYGTNEEGHVMSEKVSSLATNIYKEFERMIKKYDEDVVKELMPLVVGILESLDQAYSEKQEIEVELELLREDNEQLLTQYEREKQLRKGADQKYLEMEDAVEGEKKQREEKVESLESIVRMLELKAKNAGDHLSRMEEKEAEMKKEYAKLHERYTELFKTHMDYMERTKMLMGTDRIADLAMSPRMKGFHLPNLRPVSVAYGGSMETPVRSGSTPPSVNSWDLETPRSGKDSTISLRSELSDLESPDAGKPGIGRHKSVDSDGKATTTERGQVTDSINVREFSTGTKQPQDLPDNTVPEPKTSTPQPPKEEKSEIPSELTENIVNNVPMRSETVSVSDSSLVKQTENIQVPSVSPVIEKSVGDSEKKVSISEENGECVEKKVDDSGAKSPEIKVEEVKVAMRSKSKDVTPPSKVAVNRFSSIESDSYEEDRIPGLERTLAHIVATTPELDEMEESIGGPGTSVNRSSRNNESIFDELVENDADVIGDVDYGADLTGREVHPGEYASSGDMFTYSDDENERNSTVSDNFFGMGKEVENLILENTELLATKNALNIVKDDLIAKVDELSSEQEILREEINSLQVVKTRLQARITELEQDLKKTKEQLEKKGQTAQEGEEDDVPMAQRKRFTRVEMARVLMERNQYKERLMELQEAVRWTEMIRASREHPELTPKKKSSIWNFFSNLFSSSNKPSKKPLPAATVKYNAPTTQVQPVGDPNQETRGQYNLGDKAKAYDFLQDDIELQQNPETVISQPKTSEKVKKHREQERKEQYKQVRAHVRKEDGRMQAYGWSLPAKFTPQLNRENQSKSHIPVPVPVYCRPLLEKEPGLKIWCACGVTLTGGRTRDGGSIVGASVFYSNPPESETDKRKVTKNEVEKLNQELKEHEKSLKEVEHDDLSSLVWICTSTSTSSYINVIDANNPSEIIEYFRVSTSPILCIASIPGALESDYPVDEEILKAESYPQFNSSEAGNTNGSNSSENGSVGGITLVQCATGPASNSASPIGSPANTRETSPESSIKAAVEALAAASSEDEKADSYDGKEKADSDTTSIHSKEGEDRSSSQEHIVPTVFKAKGSPVSSGTATPTSTGSDKRSSRDQSELVRDGISSLPAGSNLQYEEAEKMNSVLPTMWMGSQSGSLYVHSSVTQWKRCLHSVKLRDSILNIVHLKGRVLVALADGTVAIFHRATDGQWDLQNYHLLDLGKPHHSIRCMTVIANRHVWCGYKNKIHVVDPQSMIIEKSFDAHPRKESQVRQLAWLGDGVWVSIRLDSTLRLYHAYTHLHLQDVDIEPYVSKMLGTGKLGFSFVRITSMLISCNRLWIGTGNGVIISVPLSESNKQTVSTGSSGGRPGGIIRVYTDTNTDSVTPGTFIPYCTMAQAQLSFHGHRDAVKFFVAVPGLPRKGMSAASSTTSVSTESLQHEAVPAPPSNTKLVLSGGEGYVDFRIGDGDDDEAIEAAGLGQRKSPSLTKGDRSHLIVWEVTSGE